MTHIHAHDSVKISNLASIGTAQSSPCSLVLGDRRSDVDVPALLSSHICWTGRSGKDYLLERCRKDLLFHRDNRIILLAKKTGFGSEVALWVGQASDLADDPGERARFRLALNEMDQAYLAVAPTEEDALHILLWDLEKAAMNLTLHVA